MFPATHPEFATADTTQFFNQSLNEALFFWDFAFAISEFSARAFREVAAARGFPPIETVAVPLAHGFGMQRSGTAEARPIWLDTWPAALDDMRGRDFVLAVSTIEVRKNHLLLFHAWRRMIEAGDDPPPLVLVGRPGWRVQDFMGQLEATRNLDGRILVLHGLSDAELEAVYRACLFTVMPSFVEGWGLSVGESLSFGKACIASASSALPEVGGDLVAYADPGSVPDWVSRLRGWLQNRPALAAAEARIAAEFIPRRWPEVARHLLDEATRLCALPPRGVAFDGAPLHLPSGTLVAAGIAMASVSTGAAQARAALAQAISLESGWYPAEAGCTWMRGRASRFVASTEEPPGSIVSLALELHTTPWPSPNTLILQIEGGEPVRLKLPENTSFQAKVTGPVGADGMVRLHVRLEQPVAEHGPDPRRLCLAFRTVTLRRVAQVWLQPVASLLQALPGVGAVGSDPPKMFLLGRLGRFLGPLDPARRLRQKANAARDVADWDAAARLYGAYLQRHPAAAAIHVQHGNALSMAGKVDAALTALDVAARLGDPHAAEMRMHANNRAGRSDLTARHRRLIKARPFPSLGQRRMVDVSALLLAEPGSGTDSLAGTALGTEAWAARRWRLAVAQALLGGSGAGPRPAQYPADLDVILADAAGDALWLLPPEAAQALLHAAPDARLALLAGMTDALRPIQPVATDQVLVLGLGPSTRALRAARQAGARVALLLAEPAALSQPHRAAPGLAAGVASAVFGPESAFDAVLLAMPDAGAMAAIGDGGRPDLACHALPPCRDPALPWPSVSAQEIPTTPFILATGGSALLPEAWALLRAARPNLPALVTLTNAATGLDALLAQCVFAVMPDAAGAWPALRLAALRAGKACLAAPCVWLGGDAPVFDPLDARASAAALAALLDETTRAALADAQAAAFLAAGGAGHWAEVAAAAWTALAANGEADPAFPAALAGDAAAPFLAMPLAEHGWALAATRGHS